MHGLCGYLAAVSSSNHVRRMDLTPIAALEFWLDFLAAEAVIGETILKTLMSLHSTLHSPRFV